MVNDWERRFAPSTTRSAVERLSDRVLLFIVYGGAEASPGLADSVKFPGSFL